MSAPIDLAEIYRDLHSHPELSLQETRTAGIVAQQLGQFGYQVEKGVGGTGVVGVLRNGGGATALLRADMDALPVKEQTGLPSASTAGGTDRDGHDVPVMQDHHVRPGRARLTPRGLRRPGGYGGSYRDAVADRGLTRSPGD